MIPLVSLRRNMFANFAPQTTSSALYEDLECTDCDTVVVGPDQKNQEFRVCINEILVRQTPHGTVRVDWMHHRPTQCEDHRMTPARHQVVNLRTFVPPACQAFENQLNHVDQAIASRMAIRTRKVLSRRGATIALRLK